MKALMEHVSLVVGILNTLEDLVKSHTLKTQKKLAITYFYTD